MHKLIAVIKDFFQRKKRVFYPGQTIYHSQTGRIALVESFDPINRKMTVRYRHNVSCDHCNREINAFRPYFGMLDPLGAGGFEDGYIDTIYDSEPQCDKVAFMEKACNAMVIEARIPYGGGAKEE